MKKYLFTLIILTLSYYSNAQVSQADSKAFIERVIPGRAGSFLIESIPQENGRDVFELDGNGSKIILRGNNGLSIASALNYYLKNYCHCDIGWNGTNLNIPVVLPPVKTRVHKTTPYTYRYY